jgi:hypothetical protein
MHGDCGSGGHHRDNPGRLGGARWIDQILAIEQRVKFDILFLNFFLK